MEPKSKKKGLTQQKKLDIYKAKMQEIDFMSEFLKDIPEVFDISSIKCKLFLLKCFTILNPNFHYLSLLSNDAIDQELMKAACILQIYPYNQNQKATQLFFDVSDSEIHNFWMRFFKQCELHSIGTKQNAASRDCETQNKFCSNFSELNKILQYTEYDISVINSKVLKGTNVNDEIESWTIQDQEKSEIVDVVMDNTQKNEEIQSTKFHLDLSKLVEYVQHIKNNCNNQNVQFTKQSNNFNDFFENFTSAVQQIITFRENLKTIGSPILDGILNNITTFDENVWLVNHFELKRCNSLISKIEEIKL